MLSPLARRATLATTLTAERRVLEAVSAPLSQLGFRKRAGLIFTIDLPAGVIGWLGLNGATRHRAFGEIEINPVVGVRFQDLERMVAECRGEQFHPYQPPTISSPLGYRMPQARYKGWVFGPARSADVAADLVAAVATYGLPSMRSVLDLSQLCRCLERRSGFEHQLIYRRPVAAFLVGDFERAHVVLDAALSDLGARTDPAAAEFRRFADALRGRLPPR